MPGLWQELCGSATCPDGPKAEANRVVAVIATELMMEISDAEARANVCVWRAPHDDFCALSLKLSAGEHYA